MEVLNWDHALQRSDQKTLLADKDQESHGHSFHVASNGNGGTIPKKEA